MITNDERLDVQRIARFIDGQSTLADRYTKALKRRADEFEFNVFNVVSDTYYRENLHSDILGAFLDPQGPHGEHSKYLDLFLRFLAANGVPCDLGHYSDATVTRETGRIDLLIKGDKRAIIIENKIKGAKDQEEQLPRYWNRTQSSDCVCDAIIYLRLSEYTRPDTTSWKEEKEEVEKLLKVMCFYDGTDKDLLRGWIRKCESESQNPDVRFVLKHYGNLVEKLGVDRMSEPIMNEFYEMMTEEEKFRTAVSLREMLDGLVRVRCRKIVEEFDRKPGCAPFKNVVVTPKGDYVQFFINREGGCRVDIEVQPERYGFYFWVNRGVEDAARTVLSKMERIGQFTKTRGKDGNVKWKLERAFRFPSEEHELYNYIRDFNQELRKP